MNRECHNIIGNREVMSNFIHNVVPDLQSGESLYVTLFARKKYDSNLPSDKAQLKRFNTYKDLFMSKITQLESPIGSYTVLDKNKNEMIIQDNSTAIYMTVNPRSNKEAVRKTVDEYNRYGYDGNFDFNPRSVLMSNFQKSCSRNIYHVLDIDISENKEDILKYTIKPSLLKCLNKEAIPFIIDTRGGFHVYIKMDMIEPKLSKNWFNAISQSSIGKLIDQRGDLLSPIPGSYQGGKLVDVLFEF